METTINTFSKFKGYKEKRVRELLHKYNVFCGVSWGWIVVISGICSLFLLSILLRWLFGCKMILPFGCCNLILILILFVVFTILAIVKYYRARHVQKVVYGCLSHLSCYENEMHSKIELDSLRARAHDNSKEIERINCLINNLDLKCEIIDKQIRINYCKSFICTICSMSLDEYKNMIKDKVVLLQEKCSYRQSRKKYESDILLLRKMNVDLDERIKTIGEIVVDDNQILKDIDKELGSVLKSKILKSEIRLFFMDLIEIVSQIKI